MMHRFREIPRCMLARTARLQPRVLVALIQCATMATEVVEVATESEEDVVINCVAIFYKKRKKDQNFRKKNKFRCYKQWTSMYVRFRHSGKIRCGWVFLAVRFCGFWSPLTPRSARTSSVVLLFVPLRTTRKLKTMEMKGRLQAWFKRRILHAPNQILILVDSNKYVRLI